MATFGHETIETTASGSWANFKGCEGPFSPDGDGDVNKITIYCDGGGTGLAASLVKTMVYADSGGVPGALLATSDEVTISVGQAAGLVDFPLDSPIEGGVPYWLAFIANNNRFRIYKANTGSGAAFNADTYGDGPSNPFGAATAGAHLYTIFATYTESGGAPQNVNPTGLVSASSFGTPTTTPGGVSINATGLGSSSAFGTPTMDAGDLLVEPSGLGSASDFGTPGVLAGGVEVQATGLDSSSAFGTPDVAQAVTPTGLGSSSAFGTPTIAVGNTDAQATGLGSASHFGSTATEGGEAPTFNPATHGGTYRG